jgi:hypothetical protein
MTILTSREAAPQIREAARTGEVISDDVAQTIALWFQTPAPVNRPLFALSRGLDFDARALLTRVDELINEFKREESLMDLHALRAWTLARVPHLTVVTYKISTDDWEAWGQQWGHANGDRPEGIEPDHCDVTLASEVVECMGQWLYPGDNGYPENPEASDGYDPDDDGVWVHASLVDAAAAMLAGKGTHFWAQSYGGNPFAPGEVWSSGDTFEEHGPGKPYASRYIKLTGEVEIKFARLVGFTEEQEAQVYRAWK